MNRQIKVIDSGFKAAAAGMDDWGQSEDGLRMRIESLNQITDLQRQKVVNLTDQYQKVAAEKGENSKAAQDLQVRINKETEALNKNLAEINKAAKALDTLSQETEQAAKDAGKLDSAVEDAGASFRELGGNVADAAAMGIAAIGSAATAAVGALLKFGDDSNKAMNKFQAQTGASVAEMEEFRDIAADLYKANLGESVGDVANAMATVKRTTGETGEALEELTKHALVLRDTFDFDMNETTRTANTLMKQFGITGEEAMTLIAQGAQKGADKNGDLLDTLNEYAPQFKALGFNADEFTSILIQGAEKGAWSIDKVGDAVKEFNIRAKDGSKSTTDAFNQLGLDADKTGQAFAAGGDSAQQAFAEVVSALNDVQDPLQRNQIGVALFGTQFEDLEADAILALGSVEQRADHTADTLGQINAVQYNDIGSALEGLKRQLVTSVAEPIGQQLLPRIQEMVGNLKNVDVTPIVNGFAWIIDNAGNLAAGAVAIGAGMLTWNVVGIVQSVIGAIKTWQLATEGMTVAQAALNLVMSLNPIGLVITAIAALVAGITVLWNTNEGFRNAVLSAWDAIKDSGVAVWEWLVKFFTEDIPEAFRSALDWFKRLPDDAATYIGELPGKLGYELGLALGALVKWGSDSLSWVNREVPKIIAGIVTFFLTLPGRLADAFRSALGAVSDWIADATHAVVSGVPKIVDSITGFFAGLPGQMVDIGKDVVRGLWNGISGMTSWMKDKVSDFAGGVVSGIKDALGIHSPSRVMRDQVGKMIGAGMAEGIADSTRQVNAAIQQLNGEVVTDPARSGRSETGWIGETNITNISMEGLLSGASFNVRTDNDIPAIASHLGQRVVNTFRAMGVSR